MQKHVIKRQIIELAVPDQAGSDHASAQRLQSEVSRIYRQRIVPILDQVCSELSAPDRIHRIERLELDLGQLDPENLEQELVSRARDALRQALTHEIALQEQNGPFNGQTEQTPGEKPQTRSQLELVAFFLRTGSLPWWADSSQPDIVNHALRFLLENASVSLQRLMPDLLRSEAQTRRLVQTTTDAILAQIVAILATTSDDLPASELIAFMTLLTQANLHPANLLRQQFWLILLPLSAQSNKLSDKPIVLYQTIVSQLAARLAIPYTSLLDALQQTSPLPETLKSILEALRLQKKGGPSESTTISLDALVATLRRLLVHLPEGKRNVLLAEFNQLEGLSSDSPDSTLSSRALAELAAALRRLLAHLPDGEHNVLLAELNRLEALSMSAHSRNERIQHIQHIIERLQIALEDSLSMAQPDTPDTLDAPDLSFSEADEVYIHNAGLVMLWPFLAHFFENLDLLIEKRFKNENAQHRAVAVLQYLVHPAEAFPEYLLPLNKVLCGLDLAQVFALESPLSETDIAHCDPFLEAIIAQAPILKNMSVDALRGTFLLREGILSRRDGAWLLRVERETYDIVLDQFPWSWPWIKLPWMATPLRVEW